MNISLIIIMLLMAPAIAARVITAGPGQQYRQIKPALDAAAPYDTVLVKGGFYQEGNIVISKPLFFLGEQMPVLDGNRRYEVLTIKADHVTVNGFKIQRSGYGSLDDPGGLKVFNCNYATITNNILYDNFFGIYIQYGKHCTVKNNRITAFGREEQEIGNGIHCWKSDSLQITANAITGHRDGIYFEFVTHSVIWRNISHHNIRYGLHFMFSNNDAYFTNVFRSNGAGVAVMYTKNVTMMNNSFTGSWGDAAYGMLLKEISDSYVSGNRFTGNTSGIFMEGTSRITAEYNLFGNNGWGVKIQASCMDNVLTRNNFTGNTFDIGTNGSLVLNTLENNYWDKYNGYDLDYDGTGDVPWHPLSLFSVIVENNPSAMLLHRSFMVSLLDKSEKVIPSLTPDNFVDNKPAMKAWKQ